jgi:FAD/FMN-containing dehydrogenase
VRVVLLLVAILLGFGVAVSLLAFWSTPALLVASRPDSSIEVREVTRLYPVTMARAERPRTTEEVAAAVRSSTGPISIGGGRYSMGGQTATPGGLQLDLRDLHGVTAFDPAAKTVTVRAGTTWRELQGAIDPANLAVKIMQTYDTFTVGGSLSVNCHGRYIGQGPLVRSVRSITLVLADGSVVKASPTENSELFYGAIGGYGALGVIADATLDLADNTHVRREDETMPLASYPRFFRGQVRDEPATVFHNADIYPPKYDTVHVVSYRRTDAPLTVEERLQPADQGSWSRRLGYSLIAGAPGGRWLRRRVLDPLMFRGNPVTWRNWEASYDVSELEPASRTRRTYVLHEYFVPVARVGDFVPQMREILRRHDVDAVNVSIRHALPDPGTLLAWAPEEVFAFVLYYRQGTDPESRREVARWTRELIDAALQSGGRYYLPYQPVATRAQLHRAYPGATRLFALKRRVDPQSRFTNVLWDLYQPAADGTMPPVTAARMPATLQAEARIALDKVPGYARTESAAYATHPEWDLVYSSEAYARWLERGLPPSAFPYVGCVGTFWRAYDGALNAAQPGGGFALSNHVMLGVIGVSTAVEYGLKGAYETSVGRLTEPAMPRGGTAEDRYAARVAADYAKLITHVGWYEFPFGKALVELWTTVPAGGPGQLRKWERRFALSGEYALKAVYAELIGFGTRSAYDADEKMRYIVAAGWTDDDAPAPQPASSATTPLPASPAETPPSARFRPVARLDRGYTLLAVERYTPFRDALLALADRAGEVRLAEVSGADVVTLSGTAPRGWTAPARATTVVAYATPGDPSRLRALLRVRSRDLLDVLHELQSENRFAVEHVYDY